MTHTKYEREIVNLCNKGYKNKQIAEILNLKTATIRNVLYTLKIKSNHKLLLPTTYYQDQIILGTLLGDANITSCGRIGLHHSEKQLSYLLWKIEKLDHLFGSSVYKSVVTGLKFKGRISSTKIYTSYKIKTLSTNKIQKLYKTFLPYKTIRHRIKITPIVLAVWAMDDGYKSNGSLMLSTDGFDTKTVSNLCKWIKEDLNLDSYIYKYNSARWRIGFRKKCFNRLKRMIKPHFHPSMLYKLSL